MVSTSSPTAAAIAAARSAAFFEAAELSAAELAEEAESAALLAEEDAESAADDAELAELEAEAAASAAALADLSASSIYGFDHARTTEFVNVIVPDLSQLMLPPAREPEPSELNVANPLQKEALPSDSNLHL